MRGDSGEARGEASTGATATTSRRSVVRLLLGGGPVLLAGCTNGNGDNPNDADAGGNPSPTTTASEGGDTPESPPDEGPPEGSDGEENPNDPIDGGNHLEFPFGRDFTTDGPFEDRFEEFERFEQSAFDYAFRHPAEWEVNEPGELTGAVLVSEPAPGNAFVYVAPFESAGDLAAHVDRVRSGREDRQLWANVDQLGERRLTTEGGATMLVQEFQYTVREVPVRETIGFLSAEFDYTVSVFANAERYTEALGAMAMDVVASFRLLR